MRVFSDSNYLNTHSHVQESEALQMVNDLLDDPTVRIPTPFHLSRFHAVILTDSTERVLTHHACDLLYND